ncbi:MAG: 30S ribosomal protein S12 methylthiotransferase RimO [Coriobacteriales bacterium]|nr:30S ribosomal protein S12 methylthiotransferase RimO [Actinomycetes bacterium]
MSVPSIAFITLGCPKNEVDTDRMRAAVNASAYTVSVSSEDADVVVLNTCAFIQDAVEEAIAEIMDLAEWKAARDGRLVVVTGCLPSRYGAALRPELPEVDAFVPVAEENTLLDVLERLTGVPACATKGPSRTVSGTTAYVQISDGCDRRCAYCAIPSIRGPHKSRPLDDVVDEAQLLIDRGTREIVLVGQDTSSWGRDLAGQERLPELLHAVASLPGDYRVRLMYLQPDGISGRLLDVMAGSDRICRYLDIPVQHASRDVLRRMGRTGDYDSLLALVEGIRKALPGVTLRTTVMAGFPGETRQDAQMLERFVQEAAFDYTGVFAFSAEEGTPAAGLPGQVPRRTRLSRAQRLADLGHVVGAARAARHVGSTVTVLVEEGDEDGMAVGRTCGQAPEIDGVTLFPPGPESGTFARVRIDDSDGYDLIGQVIA